MGILVVLDMKDGIYGFTKCKWLVISYVELSALSEHQNYYLPLAEEVIFSAVPVCVCLFAFRRLNRWTYILHEIHPIIFTCHEVWNKFCLLAACRILHQSAHIRVFM